MNPYKCEACGKFRKPEKTEFAVGDTVKFAVSSASVRGNIRLTQRDGKVLERDVAKGHARLLVKIQRIKAPEWVRESNCLPADAPGPLTYALLGTCECGGAA